MHILIVNNIYISQLIYKNIGYMIYSVDHWLSVLLPSHCKKLQLCEVTAVLAEHAFTSKVFIIFSTISVSVYVQ
jgi:hypothetical protein